MAGRVAHYAGEAAQQSRVALVVIDYDDAVHWCLTLSCTQNLIYNFYGIVKFGTINKNKMLKIPKLKFGRTKTCYKLSLLKTEKISNFKRKSNKIKGINEQEDEKKIMTKNGISDSIKT
ncbi:hypothetical protein BpHYR1_021114 [Brachionus plicatilis]|uniref:Uncharacterized protein n=1 Tax=Brachionus plicatilis TaxID=10195 RepID=A0A3M7SDM9_BRAPC|nr:hypothetical protein BpHYR1_021114 [Brachionus plicatilis]